MSITSSAVTTIFKASESAPTAAEPAVRAALTAFFLSMESLGIAYLRISKASVAGCACWHSTHSILLLYHIMSK